MVTVLLRVRVTVEEGAAEEGVEELGAEDEPVALVELF